ncbi:MULTISPECIES: hypothetical protein [Thalassospira]|uniref:hypothetical protein n=1 Tax=Thalassospira TaxID=168934 RepID=UPI00080FEB63|nr:MULTISPECIES: hypothetical protein [Thalassospira]OCK08645.1 hypothetical protein KO164_2824 [Thalassospira sp. KO164]SEE54090.1 hypothetical protein SAMN04515623_2853 [Thalassospira permensis]
MAKKSKTNKGAMMQGGRSGKVEWERPDENQFYPTPPEATEALLRAMPHLAGQKIWECACGDGRLAKVLEFHGCKVICTDLIDRGYGEGEVDFLATTRPRASKIITNPPFTLAQAFIEHAMRLHMEEVWMLLKTNYYQAANRQGFKARIRPKYKLELSWRIDSLGLGNGALDCAWFGFIRDYSGPTLWDTLPKPKMGNLDLFIPERLSRVEVAPSKVVSDQGVLL